MAGCPRCGKRVGLLIKVSCGTCGKKYCLDCGNNYITGIEAKHEKDSNGNSVLQRYPKIMILCKDCLAAMEARLTAEALKANPHGSCPTCGLDIVPTTFRLGTDDKVKFDFPDAESFSTHMLNLEAYCPKCSKVYSKRYIWANEKPYDSPDNWDDPRWFNYSQARLAESVERVEDAADYYEKAGMLEKAKQLRIKNRNQVVHHITVDVNKLLEFLRDSNFTIPYKCPSCHATIKINSQRDANKFFTCEYCGTSLQAIDVQNLINDMM